MQHAPEVKAKALKLSDKVGPKKAAEILGISRGTIERWRYERNCKNGNVRFYRRHNLKWMQKQIAELEMAKKILLKHHLIW